MTSEQFEKIKQRHNTLKAVSSACFSTGFLEPSLTICVQRIEEMETKNRELERTVKALRSGSELVAQKVCQSLKTPILYSRC